MNGSKIFEAPAANTSTVFLDWFKDQSQLVWEEGLEDLWNLAPYDGITLNHNTPSIDCNGGRPLCNGERLSMLQDDGKDTSWYLHYGAEMMTKVSTYFIPFIP